MIDTKAIRAKVLDLAIRGKLTEQLESDGTAEELLGELHIFKNEYSTTMESKPFTVPETWKWICLGNICTTVTGRLDANQQDENGEYPFFTCGTEVYKTLNYAFDCDAILLGGNNASGDYKMHRYCGKFNAYQRVYVISGPSKDVLDYVYLVIRYWLPYLRLDSKGVTTRFIRIGQVNGMPVPLPPKRELIRIITKVNEANRILDTIDYLQTEYSADTETLKAKLIDAGIRGQLTEQLPEDGTAEELYQQIREEKARLVKDGKIKKSKELPPISENEIPFEIPENWKWVRLDDIVGKTIKRGKSPKYAENGSVLVFAQKCNTKSGIINLKLALRLEDEALSRYSNEEFLKSGDIVINSTGTGTLGRIGRIDETTIGSLKAVPDSHVTTIRCTSFVDSGFAYWFLKSRQTEIEGMGQGSTNQKELYVDAIRSLIFSLPPLAEQKRIAERIDSLMELIGA